MPHDFVDEPEVAARTNGPGIARRELIEDLGLNAALHVDLLALGANPKEFEFVSDALETVSTGNLFFPLLGKTFLDFHDRGTLGADEMVVMGAIGAVHQFESRDAVP